MEEVWAVIVGTILVLIIYSMINSKIKFRQTKKQHQNFLPLIDSKISQETRCNVYLNNGQKFLNIELLGITDSDAADSSLWGWENMLILKKFDGKRIFLRQSSLRCVEEI